MHQIANDANFRIHENFPKNNRMLLLNIPDNKRFEAFAMIVDINGFTRIVEKGSETMAQDIRDTLIGGIHEVQSSGGEVVGFMGDAFLALLPTIEAVYISCLGIARDIDKLSDYISSLPESFPHMPNGPSIKIGVEFGSLDHSEIQSNYLGKQKLFIGSAINYAARISQAKKRGNRCLLGPIAAEKYVEAYGSDMDFLEGPFRLKGKPHDDGFTYYQLLLGNLLRDAGKDSIWK